MTIFKFAEAMSTELVNNSHKGGWESCSISWLLLRAKQELGELRTAVERNASPEEVLSEAADVANFCMMIAENYAAEFEEAKCEAANVRSSF